MATTHTPFHQEPLNVVGIGLPMVDFITTASDEPGSTRQELLDGIGLIEQAKAMPISAEMGNDNIRLIGETRDNGKQHIEEAVKAFDAFEAFVAERGYQPKQKLSLSPEDDAQVATWFRAIITAAIDIRRAAEFTSQPEKSLHIRHMGGTTYNKLHTIQTAMGDRVATHMLGALGDEDETHNRSLVSTHLKDLSNIDFHTLEEISLGNMAVGYILQKGGDRLALKSCTPELFPMLKEDKHIEQIHSFANVPPADMYLMEAGDFSKGKFGDRCFAAFEERALASGKPIMLGLPTDVKLIHSDTPDAAIEANRQRVFRLIDAPNTNFIGSNEEEAVAMFCDTLLCKEKTPEGREKADAQIQEACEKIQTRLKQKVAALPAGAVEPLAFVSNGVKGVYAITQDKIELIEGKANPKLVNNIGAGDALFAGSLQHYIDRVIRPIDPSAAPIARFSTEDLKEMFTVGQEVAFATVGQKGAQLSKHDLLSVLHKDGVPTRGEHVQTDGLETNQKRAI